jgi:hypothetical protein
MVIKAGMADLYIKKTQVSDRDKGLSFFPGRIGAHYRDVACCSAVDPASHALLTGVIASLKKSAAVLLIWLYNIRLLRS